MATHLGAHQDRKSNGRAVLEVGNGRRFAVTAQWMGEEGEEDW